MDYSVGSVAALISGNVTPNRPRLIKRALTPTKHQPSPNVTPKSELVDDRSIFLSPSLQKKKAIVKKSPKRIFQNPDLDVTNDGEGSSSLLSPKAEKVKKHLKDDLEGDPVAATSPKSPKSPKKRKGKVNQSVDNESTSKEVEDNSDSLPAEVQSANESTPKKKKKHRASLSEQAEDEKENVVEMNSLVETSPKSSKRKRKSNNLTEETVTETAESAIDNDGKTSPKKKKKNKKSQENTIAEKSENVNQTESLTKKKKKKNKKKKPKQQNKVANQEGETKNENILTNKQKSKSAVNPNAITNKDTDSEHESDDEIESENEKINNEVLDTGPVESGSSDDEEEPKKETKKTKNEKIESKENSEEEVKRTIFIGNVPFSKKCKKEIKKIFSKHGEIETVRIRTIPVKDARVTPKLAVIKNELHPERSTVNVYVKFKSVESVNSALSENNTVLNEHHLRVTRSEVTGTEHDPRKAIFVGNLPFSIEDDSLRAKFESCGEIESVRIIRDKKTNAGKGFGYVNFASKDGVELALSMSEEDLTIKNRILRVKRCSLQPNKQKGPNQGNRQFPAKNQGNQRNNGPVERQSRPGNVTGRYQGNAGKNQGFGGRDQGGKFAGRNQGGKFGGRDQGTFGGNQPQDGAYRRIKKKRENEESSGGPPNKMPRQLNQPQPKDKKPRKEFVGMTAEKKKKRKFDKGQKKKRAISEILTKNKESVK